MCAQDVGLVISQAMAVDRGIGGARIEVTGFHLRDLAPGCHRGRGQVLPCAAVIGCFLNQSIIGSDPDGFCVKRRRTEGVDHTEAILHRLIDIRRRDGVEVFWNFRVHARQIGADLFPGLAAVARAKDELVGVIERLICRRKDLWKSPGLAVGIVGIRRR